MSQSAYSAVKCDEDAAGYTTLDKGFVRLTGRDRLAFLQGQVSSDVLQLMLGATQRSCLLNNTGHLLAELYIHAGEDFLLLITDASRAKLVAQTLDRFLVRERVEIEDVSHAWRLLTVQGNGARRIVTDAVEDASSVTARRRLGAPDGYDLLIPSNDYDETLRRLTAAQGAIAIDPQTYEICRIEAGEPAWGHELSESIIPLEAGMNGAISYTKGCYMGQEIIARIHSRGHTNRTLRGFRPAVPLEEGAKLSAVNGERVGQEVAAVTSAALSPQFGPIALGYVRNEYAAEDTELIAGDIGATVRLLPFRK